MTSCYIYLVPGPTLHSTAALYETATVPLPERPLRAHLPGHGPLERLSLRVLHVLGKPTTQARRTERSSARVPELLGTSVMVRVRGVGALGAAKPITVFSTSNRRRIETGDGSIYEPSNRGLAVGRRFVFSYFLDPGLRLSLPASHPSSGSVLYLKLVGILPARGLLQLGGHAPGTSKYMYRGILDRSANIQLGSR
jgi:hypothetical protein